MGKRFDAPPPRPMEMARPAWQRKSERQGGNLVGSGFLAAVINGDEPLTEAEAEALLSGASPRQRNGDKRSRPSA